MATLLADTQLTGIAEQIDARNTNLTALVAKEERIADALESIQSSDIVTGSNKADIIITTNSGGSVASFSDGGDGMPMESLIVSIEPVQDTSSGDPSPTNVCEISGWTEVNISLGADEDSAEVVATTTLGTTVYGGTLDVVSGVLNVATYYESYAGETLVGPWVSSMDVYEEGTTPTEGAQVVDLGDTTSSTLTAQEVDTLLGDNVVYADCGDISSISYRADTKLYIDNAIAAAIAAL